MDAHLRGLQAVFEAAQRSERAAILGDSDVEWGIAYHDNPKEFPIDPIKHPKAAQGIFKHYGEPGDKLVKRIVHSWTVEAEKS